MKGKLHQRLTVCVLAAGAVCFLTAGVAFARGNWADDIANWVKAYARVKTTDPVSVKELYRPYVDQIQKVQHAVAQNDRMAIRSEMGKFFEMLRTRAHGISESAAKDLYNLSLNATPLEEYGVSVPEFPMADLDTCQIGASIANGDQFKHYGRWC